MDVIINYGVVIEDGRFYEAADYWPFTHVILPRSKTLEYMAEDVTAYINEGCDVQWYCPLVIAEDEYGRLTWTPRLER